MWSRHLIEFRGSAAAIALATVLLSGCASGPESAPQGEPAATVEQREVPPRVQALYEQATAAMAAGEDLDAELRLKEFLLQHADWPGAHVNLAILAAKKGDDLAAEAHIQSALKINPGHAAALNQLGMLKRRQGLFEEAESAYLKAVTASPEYPLAHYNLGVLNELYLQKLDTALLHFERYLELGGQDEEVEKWVADLKRRIGASQRTANVTE
jgi:Tfp pilus assembly protein PilF